MRAAVLASALTFFTFVPSAHALECGTHLVTEGDTQQHLLESCGAPTIRGGGQARRTRYGTSHLDDVWTYDFGPNRDRVVITMRAGVIIAIRTAGRGTRR